MQTLQSFIRNNVDPQFWLPIFTLVVAALAVVVGPLISLRIGRRQSETTLAVAKRQVDASLAVAKQQIEASLAVAKQQVDTSLEVSRKQVIAPMRQRWIENLRDRVTELGAIGSWFFTAPHVNSPDFDNRRDGQTDRMIFLRQQIELMLNPAEDDHNRLLIYLDLVCESAWDVGKHDKFGKAMVDTAAICKKILKQEWVRVKSGE